MSRTKPGSEAAATSSPSHDGWTAKAVVQTLVLLALAEVIVLVTVAPTLSLQPILEKYQTNQAAWLSAAVLISGAVLSPVFGRLADDNGKKKFMVAALVLSILGSLICLFAPTYLMLLLGRFLQGASVATIAIAVALVRQVFAPKMVAFVIALMTAGSGLVSAFVPKIFASLVEATDYRAVFWAPAIFTTAVAVAIVIIIPESPYAARRPLNPLQPLLLAASIVLVLVPITFAESWGFGSAKFVGMLIGGVISAVVWVVLSLKSKEPLLDLRVFKDVRLSMMMVIALCTGAFSGMIFLLVTFVAATPSQLGLGYGLDASTGRVGDYVSILFLAMFVGGTLGGWLAGTKVGPVRVIILGQVVGLAGIALTFASLESSAIFAIAITLIASGAGFVSTTTFAVAVSLVRPSVQAVVVSGVSLAATLSGATVSVVVFALLNRNFVVPGLPAVVYTERGIHLAFGMIGLALLVGLVASTCFAAVSRRQPVVIAKEIVDAPSPNTGPNSDVSVTPV